MIKCSMHSSNSIEQLCNSVALRIWLFFCRIWLLRTANSINEKKVQKVQWWEEAQVKIIMIKANIMIFYQYKNIFKRKNI